MFRAFKVSLDVPDDARIADCIEYIEEAVQTWRGQLRPPGSIDDSDPGHCMWELDPDTVKVTTLRGKVDA